MMTSLEELKQFFENEEWLDKRLKLICAEFMGGCSLDCVHSMDFWVDDKFCYLTWEEYLFNKVQPYDKKISLDWLVKPEEDVRRFIWEILDKQRKKEERKRKREEKAKLKEKEQEERELYEELKKKFER